MDAEGTESLFSVQTFQTLWYKDGGRDARETPDPRCLPTVSNGGMAWQESHENGGTKPTIEKAVIWYLPTLASFMELP